MGGEVGREARFCLVYLALKDILGVALSEGIRVKQHFNSGILKGNPITSGTAEPNLIIYGL